MQFVIEMKINKDNNDDVKKVSPYWLARKMQTIETLD